MSDFRLTRMEIVMLVTVTIVTCGWLLPFVQRAREAARRWECSNNLKLIGVALYNYHDTHGRFPPGWLAESRDPESGFYYGWQSKLLPFLELVKLYNSNDFGYGPVTEKALKANTNSRSNWGSHLKAGRTAIQAFRCPSDNLPDLNPLRSNYATSNYSGVFGSLPLPRLLNDRMGLWAPGAAMTPENSNGSFWCNSTSRLRDYIDGTSNTLFVGERCVPSGGGIWIGIVQNQFENDQITDCSFRSPINHSYSSFSSLHPGGCNALIADGSVNFLSDSIDTADKPGESKTFQDLCDRTDGRPINSGSSIVPY